MAHPQNSPRGVAAHKRLDIGSANLTANSTTVTLAGLTSFTAPRLDLGDLQVSGNGTAVGVTINGTAVLPTTDQGVTFTLVTNSTGVAMAINSTGSTWVYLNTTSVQPT